MTPSLLSVADLLVDLRAGYALTLPGEVELLVRRAQAARHDPAEVGPAASLAHRIQGTAGTYGFGAVSTAAERLERVLESEARTDRALESAIAALQACLPLPKG